jgi:general secretion pathway protein H
MSVRTQRLKKLQCADASLSARILPGQSMSLRTRHRRDKHRSSGPGFTLIEILVVIVIVGIISAVALLSFGLLGDDRDLQREARRLSSLIELANDEAMLQGRDYGMEFITTGYRFVELDPLTQQWVEVVDDEFLRPRQLAEQSEFDLYIEDRRVLLEVDAAKIEAEEDERENNSRNRDLSKNYAPHVLIMSSGDVTPFELTISRLYDRAAITITMSPAGELEIGSDNPQSL